MKVKVCLVGEHAVGKTSLIKRYVLNEYDDRYIVTLGAKVSKKELTLNPKGGDPVQMDMTIWDIMGSKGFRELLREAYSTGHRGSWRSPTSPDTTPSRIWIPGSSPSSGRSARSP